MTEPLKLAVITASTREGRFGEAVTKWMMEELKSHEEYVVDDVDLAHIELPDRIPAGEDARVTALRNRIEDADAYVVITCEYNHSYPASLKHAIDLASRKFQYKPVAFVSYGGNAGGQRAVEHLRAIFPEINATTVREVVVFPDYWSLFDDEGKPKDLEGPHNAAVKMLAQLAWWARALIAARPVPQL